MKSAASSCPRLEERLFEQVLEPIIWWGETKSWLSSRWISGCIHYKSDAARKAPRIMWWLKESHITNIRGHQQMSPVVCCVVLVSDCQDTWTAETEKLSWPHFQVPDKSAAKVVARCFSDRCSWSTGSPSENGWGNASAYIRFGVNTASGCTVSASEVTIGNLELGRMYTAQLANTSQINAMCVSNIPVCLQVRVQVVQHCQYY